MTRVKIYSVLLIAISLSACASIPASTSTLTQELLKESKAMHTLNISLINQLYSNRKEQVNSFITNTYTPALLDNFSKKLPDSVDYKKELPNILNSLIPIINKKKDSIQNALNIEQEQIITQLNTNYATYNTAGASLQNLIDSAIKLKTTEKSVISSVQNLTNQSVNVKSLETKLDSLLLKSGQGFSKLMEINSILKVSK
jgi:hypothetical protein